MWLILAPISPFTMLQINIVREQSAAILEGLAKRHLKEAAVLVQNVIDIDKNRRETQKVLDDLKARSNADSKRVGELMREKKTEEAEALKNAISQDKAAIKTLEEKLTQLEHELQQGLYKIPNVPAARVPAGKSAEDNVEVHKHGQVPVLPASALPHWELIKKYDIIDFDLGVKIAGAGFPVYKGKGAKMQRALINFFLDEAERAGYKEIQPPIVVNEASGYGTGQLPDKGRTDVFYWRRRIVPDPHCGSAHH